MPISPAVLSAIIGAGSSALATGGGLFSNLLHRNDARNPALQTQTGLAQAAGDSAYLSSMFPMQLAMNDFELAHNMQTYEKLGFNPTLAIPSNPSQGSYQSSQRQPADTNIDLASAFQPLMSVAPLLMQLEGLDLKRESQDLDNQKKRQDLWMDLEKHESMLGLNTLRSEQLRDTIDRDKDLHRANMSMLLAKNMSENERARLLKLQGDYQELMIKKEQAYKEYYDEVARLEKEGLERKNALARAQTSASYKKCKEIDSKIAVNDAKVSAIQSDLDSDPANHVTAVVDSIVDPKKHPTLNHALKFIGLSGNNAVQGAASKVNPFR